MNLKERIKEILEEFRTKNYHCGFKEGSTKPCKCSENIIQATTNILKAVELDEEKIINILLSRTDYGINSCYKIAKAIAKGDVYKRGIMTLKERIGDE